jgi:hypothetical protein
MLDEKGNSETVTTSVNSEHALFAHLHDIKWVHAAILLTCPTFTRRTPYARAHSSRSPDISPLTFSSPAYSFPRLIVASMPAVKSKTGDAGMRCMSVGRVHLYCKIWMHKLEKNASNANGRRALQTTERKERKASEDRKWLREFERGKERNMYVNKRNRGKYVTLLQSQKRASYPSSKSIVWNLGLKVPKARTSHHSRSRVYLHYASSRAFATRPRS